MLNGGSRKRANLGSVLQSHAQRAERRRSSVIRVIRSACSVRSMDEIADSPRRKSLRLWFRVLLDFLVLLSSPVRSVTWKDFCLGSTLEPHLVNRSPFSTTSGCLHRTDVRRRHRGQHTSPDSPSYDDQACITSMSPRNDRPLHPTRRDNTEPNGSIKVIVSYPHEPPADVEVTEETSATGSAPSTSRSVVKRRRPNAADTLAVKSLPRKPAQHECRRPRSSGEDATVPWEALSGYADVHSFSWANDPYEVDPESTMHYVDTYFIHINAATYRMFPRKSFTRWIKTEKAKSPDDLMILYTILAMGSMFSSRAERKHEGSLFSKIARYAVEKNHGNFSIQLIQSRLLLAFYHFALGETHKAWDFGGMGFRVASALKLNLEEGVTDIGEDDVVEYGLNRHALAECRRRTFWSAYMMDVSVAIQARPLIMLTDHSGSAASALPISVPFMTRIHLSGSLARRRFTRIKSLPGRHTLTTSSPIRDYARTQFHRS